MPYLKEWALAACFASVGCGVLLLLLPKSNLQSMVRAAVHIFFLVCILIPIVKLSPGAFTASWEEPDQAERYQQALGEATRRQVEQNLAAGLQPQIIAYLGELGVQEENIYLSVNTSWADGISISSVDIILDPAYQNEKERLTQALQRRFQLEFTVSCVGEDDTIGQPEDAAGSS